MTKQHSVHRHWVASVQAEATPASATCPPASVDKAKERSALCLQLGRLDPAEKALATALNQDVLASGQSFRRRGAALTDFASIGARRHGPGPGPRRRPRGAAPRPSDVLRIRRHKLQGLRTDLGPLARDARVVELGAEIDALCTT
ncbi:tetratricopeptide repeat protein [Streptomyces mirabilis]|uniref:tetratricopeptide repeat protein n=1 Tax=Streptomyces mirabilis TaxID=68239 RepID=UPI002F90D6DF